MKPALPYIVLLILVAASALIAQTTTGSVTGTVTDPSGAAMANVKISATNVATGVPFPAETNAAGVYSILFLPPGAYNVSAETRGFKKSVLGPLHLEVNQIARVDIAMEVGDLTQAVDVIAVAPILQTESVATGDTITSTKLTSLPLNGRNFATLLILIPGAITTYPSNMSTSGRFQGSGSRPQVNGNREQTNNFLLDGVDVNDSANNRIGYQPNVDALEEVKVLTGNAGAEFGNVGGASVIMTLKGGTNSFHGNAFKFLRNEKLDANGFFANRSGVPRTALRRNIFGGTLGGPLRRNRAFFFIDYEGTEQHTAGPALASVAPAAWRSGDPSPLLTLGEIVRDPLTLASFPGNIIPQARIANPVAAKLFSSPDLYPLPNNLGVGPLGVTNNYMADARSRLSNHQADAKGDWRPSGKDTISGRWSNQPL
ncbi:MAG: carboxypeptidase-like regulatory domain-containing protein [Acidobacteriia bacterium]|nr:carboxypeptidase-like regulatory domain-containing protein [Terriglobia bacterium]